MISSGSQVPVEEMSLRLRRGRGAVSPGHGEHGGLPERLQGRMPLWAAGHGPGGCGSNRGGGDAQEQQGTRNNGKKPPAPKEPETGRTAGATASTGASEAGGNTNQAAGRVRKENQGKNATGREVALPGGPGDPAGKGGWTWPGA